MKKIIVIILASLCFPVFAQPAERFMVVGDVHHYSPAADFKQTMLYEFVQEAIARQVDFLFLSGDLTIQSFGDAAEMDSALKDWRMALDTLNSHHIKLYACRGNNDGSKDSWDSLFSGDYRFPQNGPLQEKNLTYAIEYDDLLFIALDQHCDDEKINQIWLDSLLSNKKAAHLFAAGHEPAFKLLHSNCMAAFPDERNTFWESLITAGAKIFFCGHDHFYDHSIIDDGDGNAANDVHQVIVGTGSYAHSDAEYDGDNGRWTPLRLFHEEASGYVLIEILDDEVRLTWKHRIAAGVFEDGGDSYIFWPTQIEDSERRPVHTLHQNYPNPFNPVTVISYQLSVLSEVELYVYNLLGQKVATLISARQPAGNYKVEWDAMGFASGVYFYRLKTNHGFVQIKKLVLLK